MPHGIHTRFMPGEAHTGFIPGECHKAFIPLILILIHQGGRGLRGLDLQKSPLFE
ncbi:MAG: hypothetical protein OXU36_13955 [Candidatus Poribacteria bacterium]|nr:hypothetical protein [Candidatus Poribacteria bacterium]